MELPHLQNMMSSYFHQDYDLSGPDDEAILKSYAEHRSLDIVMGTVKEIGQLLSMPADGLLARFEDATGHDNMIIGETDAEARAWLEASCTVLNSYIAISDQ
jgi:hypothetical protein